MSVPLAPPPPQVMGLQRPRPARLNPRNKKRKKERRKEGRMSIRKEEEKEEEEVNQDLQKPPSHPRPSQLIQSDWPSHPGQIRAVIRPARYLMPIGRFFPNPLIQFSTEGHVPGWIEGLM